ncbi:MAG: hypothetical protein ACOX1V_02615 [Candidatus Iainarchaeum sp.]|jgi:hypothetical protein
MNLKKLLKNSIAQGTIEYLVIIAVVVVLSLIVVALSINVSSSHSQQIVSSSEKLGGVVSGGISIVEAVGNLEGDSLIMLSNNSGDGITLKKITIEGYENNYDNYIGAVDSVPVSLSGLNNSCPCLAGQKSVRCEFVFEYETKSGLVQIERRTINVECTGSNSKPSSRDPDRVIEPIIVIEEDNVNPVVTLSSPANNSVVKNKSVSFTFNVEENRSIDYCVLNVGNDSNTYTGIVKGENTINYTFANDELLDWNISCIDSSGNIGVSPTQFLNVDFNLYQIKTCVELQDMNKALDGNYVLLNSFDCSTDTSSGGKLYNEGLGFEPIGTDSNPFLGTLDGNNFTISGLNINRSTNNVGLFGVVETGVGLVISNLNLLGVNISGGNYVGGLVGKYGSAGVGGNIFNIKVDGSVNGTNYVGGVFGDLRGNLNFSGVAARIKSDDITVNATGSYVGGLAGNVYNFEVIRSSSLGNVIGSSYVGGLVGSVAGSGSTSIISNSYSRVNVTGSTNQAIGGLVGSLGSNYSGSTSLTNSYSSGSVSVFGGMGFSSGEKESSRLFFAPVPDSNVGGLIGFIYENGLHNISITSCYWDKDTSGQEYSAGESIGVTGKTTIQMKQQGTYQDWDFSDIWVIVQEGLYYPELIFAIST